MSSNGDYLRATRHPWPCLLFLLPLLAAYELGVHQLGGGQPDALRNGADPIGPHVIRLYAQPTPSVTLVVAERFRGKLLLQYPAQRGAGRGGFGGGRGGFGRGGAAATATIEEITPEALRLATHPP